MATALNNTTLAFCRMSQQSLSHANSPKILRGFDLCIFFLGHSLFPH